MLVRGAVFGAPAPNFLAGYAHPAPLAIPISKPL
jgi:hypothetical protein